MAIASRKMNDTVEYTPETSYSLGDYYRDQARDPKKVDNRAQMFLAARLCYSLPGIREHPENQKYKSNQSNSELFKENALKLSELEHWRSMQGLNIPKEPKSIPRNCLQLIKSFYVPWLNDLKPDLRARSAMHIEIRKAAFMEVYNDLKTVYNLPDGFGIDQIGQSVLAKHHHFINYEWKGPDFKHLKTKAKNGKMLDILTIIYDKRGYKKRCNNSQEDWFRKYDGEFLALSIHRVIQFLGDEKLKKMHFGYQLLSKKVKFEWSKATSLVPTSWIFGTSVDKLQMALTELLQIDIKSLKRSEDKAKKRISLVEFVKKQFVELYEAQSENDRSSFNARDNENESESKTNINEIVRNTNNRQMAKSNDHLKKKRKRDQQNSNLSNHSILDNNKNGHQRQNQRSLNQHQNQRQISPPSKRRRIGTGIRPTLTSPNGHNTTLPSTTQIANIRMPFNDRMGQNEFLNQQQPQPMGPLNPYTQSFKNTQQRFLTNPAIDKTILSRLTNIKKIRYSIAGAANNGNTVIASPNPSPRAGAIPNFIIQPKSNGHNTVNLPCINNGRNNHNMNGNHNLQPNGHKNNNQHRKPMPVFNRKQQQIPSKPGQCAIHGPKSPVNIPRLNSNRSIINGMQPRIVNPPTMNNVNSMNNITNIINNIGSLNNLGNINVNSNTNKPTSVSISISNDAGAELQRLRLENAQLKQRLAIVNNQSASKQNTNDNEKNDTSTEATIPVAVSTLAQLFEKIRTYEVFLEQLFGQNVMKQLFNEKEEGNAASLVSTPSVPSITETRDNALPTLSIPALPPLPEATISKLATNIFPSITSLGTLAPTDGNNNNGQNEEKIKTDSDDIDKMKSEDSRSPDTNDTNDNMDETAHVKSEPH